MSRNGSTVADFRAIEVNTPALSVIQDSIINAGDTMVEISLLSLLFGILTVLSFTSMYFLARQGLLGTWTNVRVLVLSNALIYMSTGTHVAAIVWNRLQAKQLVSQAMDGLFSPSYDGRREMDAFEDGMRKQLTMAVFALEVNWILGDAIVWWRACVIWRNRVVCWIGPLLLTLTLVSGLIGFNRSGAVRTTGLALLEIYNPFLATFAILSLATNVLATALIAYKTWEHRRVVKKYFSEAGTKSQVLKVLALLVESGSVYCALMMFIIIYYFRARLEPSPPDDSDGLTFTRVDTYFVYGCIGPLVAIYPTFIVFLVALKQSPIDNGGLSQIYQTHERGADPGVEGTTSAIVFSRSAFRSSARADLAGMEDAVVYAVEGIPTGDCRSSSEHAALTRLIEAAGAGGARQSCAKSDLCRGLGRESVA